jgi:acyl-CoA synthetase (AMP-forming)/AMP-acid ligase II
MHHGFYEHLRSEPSSPAVQDYDTCLTYVSLEECASRLAQALVTRFGVQTDRFVPLYMSKSVSHIYPNQPRATEVLELCIYLYN